MRFARLVVTIACVVSVLLAACSAASLVRDPATNMFLLRAAAFGLMAIAVITTVGVALVDRDHGAMLTDFQLFRRLSTWWRAVYVTINALLIAFFALAFLVRADWVGVLFEALLFTSISAALLMGWWLVDTGESPGKPG